MTLTEYLYPHVGPFMLVLARVGGLFVFAPVLSSPAIPVRIRALVAFMTALALYPALPPDQKTPLTADVLSLGVTVGAEALVGVVIGLVAAIPIYAVQLGGQVIDQQIGLALGGVYNPALDTEGTATGDLMLYLALAVFMAAGGLDALFLATAHTYGRLPIGHAASGPLPVALLTGLVGAGFELAIRVAAPVLCVVLVETVAAALVMKTIPQLNVMSVGFAAKVLLALVAIVAAASSIERAIEHEAAGVLDALGAWASGG